MSRKGKPVELPAEEPLAVLQVQDDIQIVQLPIVDVAPNEWNPNEMDDTMFNRLVEDMQNIGFLQPIFVVPVEGEEGKYRIVDGEHRYEAMRLIGKTEIPCVVVSGDFAKDEDRQKFHTMRMNRLRGSVNKKKFQAMLQDLASRYGVAELAEAMAFDDADDIAALIDNTRAQLPDELKKDFDKAKDEIKTVEDLSLVLNRLFTRYGSSLPFNFMVMDFGGKDHLWVRFRNRKRYRDTLDKADLCRTHRVPFSQVMERLLDQVTEEWLTENLASFELVNEEGGDEAGALGAADAVPAS